VRWQGKTVIVDVVGDIDLSRAPAFQMALLTLVDSEPGHIVVNLREVAYMDSSGVASLVKLLSRIRKFDVRLSLVEAGTRVRSIFEITRLDQVFEMYPTEEEALA